MKIHEVPEGGRFTSCCGVRAVLLSASDLLTSHAGIVTCDGRSLRCPSCGGVPNEVTVRTEDPAFEVCETTSLMKFDRCGHVFRVRFGLDMKIRLEEKTP